jgi:hypothetical protein
VEKCAVFDDDVGVSFMSACIRATRA